MKWEKIDVALATQLKDLEQTPHERRLNGYVHIYAPLSGDKIMVRNLGCVSYDFIDMLSEQAWVNSLHGIHTMWLKKQ